MDLWIRSQNKTKLIKVNNVEIAFYNGNYYIVTGIEEKELGKYCSYSRAKEILDEIQRKINLINLGCDFGSPMIDLKNPTYIYEMPEE